MLNTFTHALAEWSFQSATTYGNPFSDIELDVVITDPAGEERTIPTFWAGDNTWRVRYAPLSVGLHTYRTVCSDTANTTLHDQRGELSAAPYEGDNQLLRHGPLQVSQDKRYFQHRDGTPFFWLGDTWWMSLCKRLEWPGEFKTLTQDRVDKGFSVIQIIAGLYPDMPAHDERGANEAGFPYDSEYLHINPAYFDMADLRIDHMVRCGLVPCIVGCWGYFLPWMGVEKLKRHWRYLIARWGAYPVVWCAAGEGAMPYYLAEDKEADTQLQNRGWTEIMAYIREIDAYHHPLTIHPLAIFGSRSQIEDESLLDFEMLQTGHGDRISIAPTTQIVAESYASEPRMPLLNSEVCYEGIGEACRQEVQRFMFWCCVLGGACGHTYGANGLWQLNRKERPFGVSPHGLSWGDVTWQEAYQLPGSAHLGVGKKFLERYEWWKFEQHLEWIENPATQEAPERPYAAGIAGQVRVFFLPAMCAWSPVVVQNIEVGAEYRAFLFDPKNAAEVELGTASGDDSGKWKVPYTWLPIFQDWILALKRI